MTVKRIIQITLAVLAIVAAVFAISWRLSENKATMEENAQLTQQRTTVMPVTVAEAKKQSFSTDFTVNGTFEASKEVLIISDVNGRITSLKIDDGTYVKKDQPILTVDNQLLSNQLKTLELNLNKAERDLSRMSNLLTDGGVTETQYEEAKLGVENLKIQIESLQKQINDTYMKAPMSGTITGMQVEEGSYLAPGSPVANVVSINPIRLHTYLTENQVVTIKNGQKVKVAVDVFPGKEFTGVVRFIDVKADQTKRFLVEIEFANPNNIKAGMNGKATYSAGVPVQVLAIPRQAFVGSILEGRVYVFEDGTAKLREVKPGEVHGDMVTILSGLEEGEIVVKTGQINLQDGSKVKILEQ